MIEHDNLEEFADPARYDLEDGGDTGIAFYLSLARETGGPVLDLACGTGRVGIAIAHAGFPVIGLDIVPAMLARARAKSAKLNARWVEGDVRDFDLHERFRMIFMTGNAFQALLTREDQEAMLKRVLAHLHDDGLFAFETRNPRWAGSAGGAPTLSGGQGLFALLETRDSEEHWRTYVDQSGREVNVSKTQVYDHAAQILHWTTYRRWYENGREQTKITRIAARFTFPQELSALLYNQGFSIQRQYGDWNLLPLSGSSPSIICVCRKR